MKKGDKGVKGIRLIRQYYVHLLLLLFIVIINSFVLHLLCFIVDFFVNTQGIKHKNSKY